MPNMQKTFKFYDQVGDFVAVDGTNQEGLEAKSRDEIKRKVMDLLKRELADFPEDYEEMERDLKSWTSEPGIQSTVGGGAGQSGDTWFIGRRDWVEDQLRADDWAFELDDVDFEKYADVGDL